MQTANDTGRFCTMQNISCQSYCRTRSESGLMAHRRVSLLAHCHGAGEERVLAVSHAVYSGCSEKVTSLPVSVVNNEHGGWEYFAILWN